MDYCTRRDEAGIQVKDDGPESESRSEHAVWKHHIKVPVTARGDGLQTIAGVNILLFFQS